jgi:hypothetical protein
MGKVCSTNGGEENAYRLLVEQPEGKRPLGRPRCRRVDNIRMDLERWDVVMWTGLVWLRIGTGGELLCIRYWTFGFYEMLGNYRVASWVVLSSMELGSSECFLFTTVKCSTNSDTLLSSQKAVIFICYVGLYACTYVDRPRYCPFLSIKQSQIKTTIAVGL